MTSLARSLPPVYAVGLLRLAMPLLVLPVVAARLGPEEFGRLSFILVWSSLLSTLVEGGFLAAATRLAVSADLTRRRELAQQIFTARCLLCLPVTALSFAAVAWAGEPGGVRQLQDALTVAAMACVLGWPATWYLQATQQLARWSRFEIAVYATLIGGCWAFAHSVAGYLAMQTAASALLAALGWWWVRRDLAVPMWAPERLREGLALGWTMLPVSLAGAAYTYALPAAASSQMSKAELGTYFMADRIVRAVLAAADPVFSVVYPRIVRLFEVSARAALIHALRWAIGGGLVGMVLWILSIILWPHIEPWLMPRAGAIDVSSLRPVLLVLGALLPVLLGWRFVGYWMLGSGRYDHAYRACVVIGGVVGVAGALVAGSHGGALALAWTALGVEFIVIACAIAGIALTERRTGLSRR